MFRAALLACLLLTAVPAQASDEDVFAACGVSGSVTLYDQFNERWYKTDEKDSEGQTLPASTFKIFNTLVALDEQVASLDEVFKWDGTTRAVAEWNQDTNLRDAFKNSTVWVYEEIAKRIPKDTYSYYLETTGYEGNGNIQNGQGVNFWVYGDFGVSPLDQIALLIALHDETLPFRKPTMEAVKELMKQEDGQTYGKTGWTQKDGKHIGWWVGYKKTLGKPLYFATRITKGTDQELGDFTACRKTITDEIIQRYKDTVI